MSRTHLAFSLPGIFGPAVLALVAIGCGGQSDGPTAPVSSGLPGTGTQLGAALVNDGGLIEAPLALYRVAVDPGSLTATTELLESRRVQQTDDVYLLSIDQFLGKDDFAVRGVTRNGDTLELTYEVSHPFPAPQDPTGAPNGATNRADLGIAGRVVFIADVPSASGNSYFDEAGDPVIANTALVANPDAFYRPAGLLPTTTVANTFPYQALVDESGPDGSRIGVSNAGAPGGNFGNEGWTRDELGFDNNGWTGFGVLHQGQSSRRMLALDVNALSGGFSLDVAILAKYNDPRGGQTGAQKRANRLPPALPDPAAFAYRMPHGALDVERISFLGSDGSFLAESAGTQTFSFQVTDWDARASETVEADLGGDLQVTTVAVGEAGAPDVTVCIPGVLGPPSAIQFFDGALWAIDDDSAVGGDVAQDSGQPGDGLYYPLQVDQPATLGQVAGDYVGMLRATDPEATADTSTWKFVLDATLTPISIMVPRPETYQTFVATVDPVITRLPGWQYAPNGNGTEYTYGLTVDANNNTLVAGYSSETTSSPGPVNYGGGVRTNGGTSDLYLVKLDPNGAYLWDYHIAAAGAQQMVEVVTDSAGNVYGGGFFGGTVNFGGGNRTSAGGNDIVIVKLGPDGTYVWDRPYGGTSGTDNTRGMAIDSGNNVLLVGSFGATVNFGGGIRTAVGTDSVVIKVDSAGNYVWDRPIAGPGSDIMYAGAVDNVGNLYVSGYFTMSVDYGLGNMTSLGGNDVPLIKINSGGSIVLTQKFGGTSSEWGWDITVDPVTQGPIIAGYSQSPTIDFGGGVRVQTNTDEPFVVKFTPTGTYVWDRYFSLAGSQEIYAVEADSAGNVYVAGAYAGSVDFGTGVITNAGSDDAFVVKLDAAGVPQWTQHWGGTGSDDMEELTLSPNGMLHTSGGFLSANVDFDPGPTIFLDSAVFIDGFVTRINLDDGLW